MCVRVCVCVCVCVRVCVCVGGVCVLIIYNDLQFDLNFGVNWFHMTHNLLVVFWMAATKGDILQLEEM